MAQPPGTYLKGKSLERINGYVEDAQDLRQKAKVNERQRDAFFRALDRVQEGRLRDLRKKMRALYAAAEKGEPALAENKNTQLVADGVEQLRKVCEIGQKIKELKLTLQRPAHGVLSAPAPGPAGFDLVLVVALLQVLEILIRLKMKRKSVEA